MKTHKKITYTERERLAIWKKERLSNKDCAKRLGRHVSTIGRELKRNKTKVAVGDNNWDMIYEPAHAQAVTDARKKHAWFAKEPLKSTKIFSFVMEKLREGWSPEQIAGRLNKVEHPNDKTWHICMETIYQFIYKEKTDKMKQAIERERLLDKRLSDGKTVVTVTDHEKPLYEYLRRKQVRRRKKNGRKSQRVRIPDRASIHDRPAIVAKRKQFGHWEGDSIVGLAHKNGLHTEYERVSSITRLERLLRITAVQAALAAQRIFQPLPAHAKRSTTLDNGSEHTNHKDFGLPAYFADPYSSWQRGGNENANLWIRYYFPKGTDFSTISDEELKDVEWELNNRPRKRLDFKTPQEVFDTYLFQS